jgi:hypothetical protein
VGVEVAVGVDVFTGGGVKVMVGVAVGGRGVSVGGGWAAPPQADAEKTKIIARPRHKSLWENCGFIFNPSCYLEMKIDKNP